MKLTRLLLLILAALPCLGHADNTNSNRKALVIGQGDPFRDPGGGQTHPQGAKNNFLRFVGNPSNDPAKGWTCDLSWDLMERLGLDPNKTTFEELFAYIGKHKLGYRIAMHNFAGGANASFWGAAVDNGIMPFAAHGDNTPHKHVPDPVGIKAAVSVGGGTDYAHSTYGPGLEFFDAVPSHMGFGEDAAQSWANQMLAAKFAKILDRHPEYNIWDARQHLRQAASFWDKGWTERNGYGRVNLNARVGKLMPAPPLEFRATLSRNARQVHFSWRNFPMTGFVATVIARKDGRLLHEGTGTNFTWTTDTDGPVTFQYGSKDSGGNISRMESYQSRTVTNLSVEGIPSLLVLGGPIGQEGTAAQLATAVQRSASNWLCDVVYRPGNTNYDRITSFPFGNIVGLLPDWPAMVDFAISNRYRLLVAPADADAEPSPGGHSALWSRAVAAGVAVVTPHSATRPRPRRLGVTNSPVPPRLGAAMTVGFGTVSNVGSFGPGLEFFDRGTMMGTIGIPATMQNGSAATVAAKFAAVLEANPRYNLWDARQHLRQSASHYAEGWREDGGYGRPPERPAVIAMLDLAPPLEIQARKTADHGAVEFSWLNFRQSAFAATVITKADGTKLYEGQGTNFVWRSDVAGDATFKLHTRGKSGRLSRDEAYTVIRIEGLTLP